MVAVIRATRSKTKDEPRFHTRTDIMSGDLEDFLKRAAERRQAKAAQQNQNAPQKRVPPQYSNRRTERTPRPVQDAEIVEAQVVSASGNENVVVAQAVKGSQNHARQDRSRQAKRSEGQTSNAGLAPNRQASEAKKQATAGDADSTPYSQSTSTTASQESVGFSAEDLVAMLKRPGGVQQALLLREILDRPEHRW
ncbi:MAG: hypothetical protein CMM07_08175 [Rhodopirellula sp.]|nr:hypothetical protein [Rhodopirellula sp.]